MWAVLPAKDLVDAKQRLADALSPPERRLLFRTMYEDVLSVLAEVPGLDGIAVAELEEASRSTYGAAWQKRIAEDIVMLDSLLGPDRRIMCGVGRGLGRREYAGMNIDQGEARGRFDEAIVILQQLLATGKCTFHGEHYDIDDLHLRPQPDRDMSDCLFGAGGTSDTVSLIAENGINPLTVPTVSLDVALSSARRRT